MNKLTVRWLFLGLALMASGTALAYIPSVEFLLDKLAVQRSKMGYSRLWIAMQCRENGSEPKEHVLYLKTPGLVRRERPEGTVDICQRGTCWRKLGSDQPIRLPGWAYLPYLYFVEMDAAGDRYRRLLRSLDVRTNIDTITRFHGISAVVLGAKHWERDRPQLWIDKERYLPLRLMLRDGNSILDIQWIGWGSREGGNWFPARLEIVRDGKPLEQCEIEEIKSAVSMPDSLFIP